MFRLSALHPSRRGDDRGRRTVGRVHGSQGAQGVAGTAHRAPDRTRRPLPRPDASVRCPACARTRSERRRAMSGSHPLRRGLVGWTRHSARRSRPRRCTGSTGTGRRSSPPGGSAASTRGSLFDSWRRSAMRCDPPRLSATGGHRDAAFPTRGRDRRGTARLPGPARPPGRSAEDRSTGRLRGDQPGRPLGRGGPASAARAHLSAGGRERTRVAQPLRRLAGRATRRRPAADARGVGRSGAVSAFERNGRHEDARLAALDRDALARMLTADPR